MPRPPRPKPPAPIPVLDLSPEVEALLPELQEAFTRVLRSGSFILGPEVEAFEEEVAAFLGVPYAVGLNSGTDALVIGLRALGVDAGDEVITSPFSFFATAEAISSIGAVPVFVDIDEATFNLDPALVEAAVSPRTRAIIPVHLYGRPAPMGALLAMAERYHLMVLEDCAQSFGATLDGRQTGTLGQAGAFSFFPSKNLGAFGDAGMLVTGNAAVAEAARMLRAHGARKKYHNEVLGYNSRLDALQAALLRVKLPHVAAWNEARRTVATRYRAMLAELPGVVAPEVSEGHVFHQYTVRILEERRDDVQAALAAQGISTMVYYPIPQDQLPVYKGRYAPCPVSARLAGEVLSLPIWPTISEATQARVVEALMKALGHKPSASLRKAGRARASRVVPAV
jgi:dTDP-4-amino-4,6-dideoxygalactose transaminase